MIDEEVKLIVVVGLLYHFLGISIALLLRAPIQTGIAIGIVINILWGWVLTLRDRPDES